MAPKQRRKQAALHSADTCEWGTDPEIIAHSKFTLQRIDLDPCSGVNWNGEIGALRIITEQQDCRKTPWFTGAPMIHSSKRFMDDDAGRKACNMVNHFGWPNPRRQDRRIHCNPAGSPSGDIVAHCWRMISTYYARGWISAAFWVGFSVEQLARLQRVGAPTSPSHHITIVIPERRNFMKSPGIAGTEPAHANFITLVGGDPAMRARFLSRPDLGVAMAPIKRT